MKMFHFYTEKIEPINVRPKTCFQTLTKKNYFMSDLRTSVCWARSDTL